jgi:hypothetical protein
MSTVKSLEEVCDNVELIDINFKKCVQGYHLLNSATIKESVWEEINSLIFSSVGIEVFSQSEGSHLPGMDINCSLGGISNKSAKYSAHNKSFDISSYRLTTVCSEKHCGSPEEICQEINKRKNFDYYSIILRDESNPEKKYYEWLLIPTVPDNPNYNLTFLILNINYLLLLLHFKIFSTKLTKIFLTKFLLRFTKVLTLK